MTKPTSNGCTSFPDGYWKHCCVAHDVDYALGGTWRDRLESDGRLMDCIWNSVIDKTGSIVKAYALALFMFCGVRIFGSPWCFPLYLWPRWRNQAVWGYGRK